MRYCRDMQEIIPFVYAGVGQVLDNIATNVYCSMYGTKSETGLHGKWMQKYGIWPSTPLVQLSSQALMLGIGVAAYAMDTMFHWDSDLLNFHHAWLCGVGSMPYYHAVSQFLVSQERK